MIVPLREGRPIPLPRVENFFALYKKNTLLDTEACIKACTSLVRVMERRALSGAQWSGGQWSGGDGAEVLVLVALVLMVLVLAALVLAVLVLAVLVLVAVEGLCLTAFTF